MTIKNKKSGVDFNQELVTRYRQILYPEVKDSDFNRINQVFVRDFSLANIKDFFLLKKVARQTAIKSGLPRNYFLKSQFCRFQQKRILRSLLNV